MVENEKKDGDDDGLGRWTAVGRCRSEERGFARGRAGERSKACPLKTGDAEGAYLGQTAGRQRPQPVVPPAATTGSLLIQNQTTAPVTLQAYLKDALSVVSRMRNVVEQTHEDELVSLSDLDRLQTLSTLAHRLENIRSQKDA